MVIRKITRRRPRSVNEAELGHFTLLFCRGRQGKCTEIYNARAQLLFCSLNLLFGGVLVAVVVMVCLSSLVLLVSIELWPLTERAAARFMLSQALYTEFLSSHNFMFSIYNLRQFSLAWMVRRIIKVFCWWRRRDVSHFGRHCRKLRRVTGFTTKTNWFYYKK